MLKKSTRRRAIQAEQLRLPLEDVDTRHNKKLRGVYRDRNAHHAIVSIGPHYSDRGRDDLPRAVLLAADGEHLPVLPRRHLCEPLEQPAK